MQKRSSNGQKTDPSLRAFRGPHKLNGNRFIQGYISERFFSWASRTEYAQLCGRACKGRLYPMVHTFAVFIYRRAYDQIAMSVAYPNLRVRMFGFLPGITTPGEPRIRRLKT
jgi:hypothetical protein